MAKKKTGLYDKVNLKSGVMDGGVDQLSKILNKKNKYAGPKVRISVNVPKEWHTAYKMLLLKNGNTISDDILVYIQNKIGKQEKAAR